MFLTSPAEVPCKHCGKTVAVPVKFRRKAMKWSICFDCAREPNKAREKGAFQIESERKIQKTRDRRQAYYWLLGCMAFGVAIAAKEGGTLGDMARMALIFPVLAVLVFGSTFFIYWVWALFNND